MQINHAEMSQTTEHGNDHCVALEWTDTYVHESLQNKSLVFEDLWEQMKIVPYNHELRGIPRTIIKDDSAFAASYDDMGSF